MVPILSHFAQYSSSYSYDSYTTSSNSSLSAGAIVAMLALYLVFIIGIYVFTSICLSRIFKKAGRQDAWAAWIPIYNQVVLLEVIGRPIWWIALFFIPGVNLVFLILAMIDLAKSFGKDGAFAALLVIFPVIGYPILAFGSAQYVQPAGLSATAVASDAVPPPTPPAPTPPVATPPSQPEEPELPPTPPEPPVNPIA